MEHILYAYFILAMSDIKQKHPQLGKQKNANIPSLNSNRMESDGMVYK